MTGAAFMVRTHSAAASAFAMTTTSVISLSALPSTTQCRPAVSMTMKSGT